MRRLDSMVWMLGSAAAAMCAALTITLADASEQQPAAGAVRWSTEEKAVLASLSLKQLPSMPVDPSNSVEQRPAAIELGRRLFNDTRLSRNGAVSCATCHDPAKQFQDGLPVSQGVGTGTRRAMPIVGAGHGPWLFWDGRKDSLWAQALGPLEDAVEQGTNRTRVAHLVTRNYRPDYEAIFGALPRLDGLPGDAGPKGHATEQAAWAAIDARRREEVSRVFANVGKVIAAYEKSLPHEPTRLDGYIDAVLRGDRAAGGLLRADEARGLRLFIGKAQCVSCHNGPLLSDQQFHNTGVPPRDAARPDRGRAAATAAVRADEFNCLGPFSDAGAELCQELRFMVTDDPALEGAFKTPGLRGVADRVPYMHAGQFATLEQVVRHYVAAPHAAVGHSELTHGHAGAAPPRHAERAPIELSDAEIADLVSFLGTLSADRPSAAAVLPPPRLEDGRASTGIRPEGCVEAALRDGSHLGHMDLPQSDGGTTTVFYPTEAAEAPVHRGPFQLAWAEDAQPRHGNGRLVVISHGSGGSPWVHVDLARVLVEHGFTVALPQHAGDNVQDPSEPGPTSWARRPLEASQAIDRVAADGRLAPLLRLDAVGVFGGSAGGQWAPSRFRDHCLRNIEQDFSSCVGFITVRRGDGLDAIKSWAARLVIRLRLADDTPQRHTDPRVGAAIAMVPFAADFDPESLRRPVAPLGLVIADQDINQVPRFHVEAVRAACEPRCEVLARLPEAGHGAMLSPLPPLESGSVAELCEAARAHNVTIVCDINEVDRARGGGTLYNSVVVIGPDGKVLNRHRKLMPTNPERLVHGLGDASGLRVVDTPAGRVGCLICWENYMPLARYALYAQGVEIHVAPSYDSGDAWVATMRHIALEGRCWVVGSGTALRAGDIAQDFPARAELFPDTEDWINDGDSVVVDPMGKIVAGPLRREAGVLYAEIDTARVASSRRTLDVTGHYARTDIFDLQVHRAPARPVRFVEG